MLVSKSIRTTWLILTILTVLMLSIFETKVVVFYSYSLATLLLFSIDLSGVKKTFKLSKKKYRWLQYMNLTQALFWIGLIGLIFITRLGLFYELFVIIDLFILATFATVKFQNA